MNYRCDLRLSYSSRRHIPQLDGIRGLAIFLVMSYHCFPMSLTAMGWIGVDLFFVLSGFLITGILIDSKGNKGYYRNFFGRRVLRIFPLYYLVLFIVLFLIPRIWEVGSSSNFSFYTRHQGWFWFYVENWLFSLQGIPNNLILAHFWSLAVEEQFYIVWPWVIFFTSERSLLQVSVVLCVCAFVFRVLPLNFFQFESVYRYVNTFSRMDSLIIGGVIAQLIRKNIRLLEKAALPVGISGLVIFMIGVIANSSLKFTDLPFYYTAIDLFMGLTLILSLSNIQWIRKVMGCSPLIFLGRYSYGLYVYHAIIDVLFKYKLGHWMTATFVSFSPKLLMFVFGIVVIMLSLIISILSYHLFEARFLKLKVYFPTKMMSGKTRTQDLEGVVPV